MRFSAAIAIILMTSGSSIALAQTTEDPVPPPTEDQPVDEVAGAFGSTVRALAQDPERTGGIGREVSALAQARNEERRLARGDIPDNDDAIDDAAVEGADVADADTDALPDASSGIGQRVREIAQVEREGGVGKSVVPLTPATDSVAAAKARASAARNNAAEASASGRQQASAARQSASAARGNAAAARETAASARAQASAARDNARAAAAQARAVREAVRASRPGRGS